MPTVKYIDPQENGTVRAISNLIRAGEGIPEIGFSTNLGTESNPLYRSGSGWVKSYFTTNSAGDIVRAAVPKSGLTKEQNSLSLDAAGAFYRQMMYDRFPVFAKHMPIGAMAVYSDVAHHGRQEHNKSPKWDEDNHMVWAARAGDKEAKEYLGKRGYKGADFSEVAARQLLDYYSDDEGKNRIYDRMIHRFNALRSKLPVNARPWDYFGSDYSGPRDEVEKGLRNAWDNFSRQASKGGNASGESKSSSFRKGVRLGTYRYTATNDLDRVVVDPKNIKGTGIAYDAVKDRVQIKPEDRKEFEGWLDYIAGLDPTMKKQRLVPPDWRTNPYWTSADGYQRDYDFGAAFYEGKKYDDPLTSMVKMESDGLFHLDDRGKAPNHPTFSKHSHYYLDETLRKKYGALAGDWEKSDDGEWLYVPGEAENKAPPGTIRTLREMRQASKGGNASGESKASSVPKGHNAALDGYSGPRIVINPSTFRNSKDAACVAYNEAIRVFMEANGYEPQSEPTDRQRQFFADTPYADDELQLRRTIIARICVFDTSVKDPTDDQLSESASVLRAIIDSGFAKTDDEVTKCERLARAIEAAVGAEPVEPREEPLETKPLQPKEETRAAVDAGVYGGTQDDEDDPLKKDLERFSQDFRDEIEGETRIAVASDISGRGTEEIRQEGNRRYENNEGSVGAVKAFGAGAIDALGAIDEFHGDENRMKVNAEGADYDMTASDPSKKGNLAALNEALQAAKGQAEGVDTSHIKYGPQEPKVPTMDDVGKAVAAKHQPEVVIPGDDAPAAPAQPAAPAAQEQPVQQAAAAPQQETLAPGLSRGGSRNNILEFNGRRISQREFDRIQAKFEEGGGAQPVRQAAAAQPVQVAANGEDPLKPNKLRQNTQVDSGRKDALGRPLDEYGRVIA